MKIPTDAKDVTALREFLQTVRTQVCGMSDCLTEPWKGHFDSLKKHYDDALASLPVTDQVPAALDANRNLQAFFSCLYSASALASMLGSAMNSLTIKKDEEVKAALNSALDAEMKKRLEGGEIILKVDFTKGVTDAIDARIKAGELVPKDLHAQLCSAAKDTGLSEGEKKVREEIKAGEERAKKIGERKTHLQKCGLPLPEAKIESVLAGSDEEFSAAQKQAEERIDGLRKKGVALNSKSPLMSKVWLPQDQYEVFEALTLEAVKGADPLVTDPKPATVSGPFIC